MGKRKADKEENKEGQKDIKVWKKFLYSCQFPGLALRQTVNSDSWREKRQQGHVQDIIPDKL